MAWYNKTQSNYSSPNCHPRQHYGTKRTLCWWLILHLHKVYYLRTLPCIGATSILRTMPRSRMLRKKSRSTKKNSSSSVHGGLPAVATIVQSCLSKGLLQNAYWRSIAWCIPALSNICGGILDQCHALWSPSSASCLQCILSLKPIAHASCKCLAGSSSTDQSHCLLAIQASNSYIR